MTANILTINGGSSSIKFALFDDGDPPQLILSGQIERIGLPSPTLTTREKAGRASPPQPIEAPDHERAAKRLIEWLGQNVGLEHVRAIGHRIVHGGPRYAETQRVDEEVIRELKRYRDIDPVHLPGEIALIEAFARHLPDVPQVACFDTAFHHDLPRCARLLPVPRRYESAGIRRYGFHGLSYSYLMAELARVGGSEAAQGRVVLAHLGAGASLAAVRGGKCIDTSMSFTPTAGLVMATRCGDVDPGFLVYLMRSEGLGADAIDDLVNRQSGLKGISQTSSDMRDLLARETSDPRAADAIAIFCYSARKWIGGFAAALGGIDTLVFAGGIGENAPAVRARICEGLEFLGIRLDAARNSAGAAVISAERSGAVVRVIHTDEELMIANEVMRIAPNAPRHDNCN
jgi:acetate kinase